LEGETKSRQRGDEVYFKAKKGRKRGFLQKIEGKPIQERKKTKKLPLKTLRNVILSEAGKSAECMNSKGFLPDHYKGWGRYYGIINYQLKKKIGPVLHGLDGARGHEKGGKKA